MFISLYYSYTSISNFTLNLLEDTGWYKVDYAVAESLYNYELLWGKGEGWFNISVCAWSVVASAIRSDHIIIILCTISSHRFPSYH